MRRIVYAIIAVLAIQIVVVWFLSYRTTIHLTAMNGSQFVFEFHADDGSFSIGNETSKLRNTSLLLPLLAVLLLPIIELALVLKRFLPKKQRAATPEPAAAKVEAPAAKVETPKAPAAKAPAATSPPASAAAAPVRIAPSAAVNVSGTLNTPAVAAKSPTPSGAEARPKQPAAPAAARPAAPAAAAPQVDRK